MRIFLAALFFLLLCPMHVFAEVEVNTPPNIPSDANHSVSQTTVRVDKPLSGIKVRTDGETTVISAPTPTESQAVQSLSEPVYREVTEPTPTATLSALPTLQPTSTPYPTGQISNEVGDIQPSPSFIEFFRIPLNFLFGLFA